MVSKRLKSTRSFTLVELCIAIVLFVATILAIGTISAFLVNQVKANFQQNNMLSQINYAFEDMKIRLISASQVETSFNAEASGTQSSPCFTFTGERDIYQVEPAEPATKIGYQYGLDRNDPDPCSTTLPTANYNLVLITTDNITTPPSVMREVLVESKFQPTISFEHYSGDGNTLGDPVNFFTVTITATNPHPPLGAQGTISKTVGIRLWFVDALQ